MRLTRLAFWSPDMPLKPETKYEAVVLYAVVMKSKNKGTGGIFFALKTNDGRVDHTEWISAGRAEKLRKTLDECFGIEPEALNPVFLKRICEKVRGSIVSITTDAGGQYGVKVKWMNPVGPKAATLEELKDIALILAGKGDVNSGIPDGVADWETPNQDF